MGIHQNTKRDEVQKLFADKNSEFRRKIEYLWNNKSDADISNAVNAIDFFMFWVINGDKSIRKIWSEISITGGKE